MTQFTTDVAPRELWRLNALLARQGILSPNEARSAYYAHRARDQWGGSEAVVQYGGPNGWGATKVIRDAIRNRRKPPWVDAVDRARKEREEASAIIREIYTPARR